MIQEFLKRYVFVLYLCVQLIERFRDKFRGSVFQVSFYILNYNIVFIIKNVSLRVFFCKISNFILCNFEIFQFREVKIIVKLKDI